MSIHVCKQCGSRFEYCRACVFRPIRYKDNGFCSKECYEASKIEIPAKIEIEAVEVDIPMVETEEVFIENNISEEEILIEDIKIESEEVENDGIHE